MMGGRDEGGEEGGREQEERRGGARSPTSPLPVLLLRRTLSADSEVIASGITSTSFDKPNTP